MKNPDMIKPSNEEIVSNILKELFKMPFPEQGNISLVNYYRMDSLDAVELVMTLEEDLDLKIDDESFECAIHSGFDALLQLTK